MLEVLPEMRNVIGAFAIVYAMYFISTSSILVLKSCALIAYDKHQSEDYELITKELAQPAM